MFAELCDSTWANRSRRGWTTLASFTAQVLTVGALLTLPLFYTEALPHLRLEGLDLIAPPPPPASAPSRQDAFCCGTQQHLLRPPPNRATGDTAHHRAGGGEKRAAAS